MNTQQLEQQASLHISIAINLQSIILWGKMAEKYPNSEDVQSEYQQRLDRHNSLMAQIEMPEQSAIIVGFGTHPYDFSNTANQD